MRTVVDLRATAELATDGRFDLADEVAFHHVPLFENEDPPFVPARAGDPEPPPGETYLAIATAGSAAVGRALRAIAEGNPAVVFHCAAGKDRTGIVAALLLSVLGVPDNVIVADYQLSERSVEPATAWARANDADWSAWLDTAPPWLLRSPPRVMQRFLELLRQRHGSVERYLADAGADRDVLDALRGRLLDPA